MASFVAKVPVQYAEAIRSLCVGPRVAIEHAALKTRLMDNGLLAMIADPPVGNYVILTPEAHTYRWNFERLLDKIELRASKSLVTKNGAYIYNSLTLFITDDVENLPKIRWARVIVADAHLFEERPKLQSASTTIIGEFCRRNHWFYDWSRAEGTKLIRINGDSVVQAYPDQVDEVLEAKKSGTLYKRTILLEDTEDFRQARIFTRFASSRLFVRSDKPDHFFTPAQLKEAARQRAVLGAQAVPVVPFEVSRLQQKYLAKKRLAVKQGKRPLFLLLKFRRGGFTTLEQGLNYETIANVPHSHAVTLAHTGSATNRIFSIAKLMQERDEKAPHADTTEGSIKFPSLGSSFFIGTAGGRHFGRGDTLQKVHGSEVAFWCEGPNQSRRVETLIAGLAEAASNGEIVLESTPNGVEWFCSTYREAKSGRNEWTPIFLRWFDDQSLRLQPHEFNLNEIRDTLDDEEKNLIRREKLDPGQIAWRRIKKRERKVLFAQEYPEDDETCFLMSGTPYFDMNKILLLLQKAPEYDRRSIPGGYYVEWEKPIPGVEYCIGCDTSEGLPGCDASGLGVMRRDNGFQVAALHGLFKPKDLGMRCVAVAKRYNNALLGIERNNHGHAVLQVVEESGWWGAQPHNRAGRLFCFSDGRSGWNTTSESRPIMLSNLADALVERNPEAWRDRDFLGECNTFKLQADGKFRADSHARDDSVMKWAIAEQMRTVRIAKSSFEMVEL